MEPIKYANFQQDSPIGDDKFKLATLVMTDWNRITGSLQVFSLFRESTKLPVLPNA